MENIQELAKGTRSRTGMLMWKGRDARDLDSVQEVKQRDGVSRGRGHLRGPLAVTTLYTSLSLSSRMMSLFPTTIQL